MVCSQTKPLSVCYVDTITSWQRCSFSAITTLVTSNVSRIMWIHTVGPWYVHVHWGWGGCSYTKSEANATQSNDSPTTAPATLFQADKIIYFCIFCMCSFYYIAFFIIFISVNSTVSLLAFRLTFLNKIEFSRSPHATFVSSGAT